MKYILGAILGSIFGAWAFMIQLIWKFSWSCAVNSFLAMWRMFTKFENVCYEDEYASPGRTTRFKDATVRTRVVYPKTKKK